MTARTKGDRLLVVQALCICLPGWRFRLTFAPGLVMLWPTQDAFVEHRLEASQHRLTADALLHYLDHPCDPPKGGRPVSCPPQRLRSHPR
jgi:hypothetical protein